VAWKKPHVALDVAARLPGLRVDFAGAPMPGDDPRYVAGMRLQAARPDVAGRIRWLGAVEDARPLLRDAYPATARGTPYRFTRRFVVARR